jgi:hypothetical protein
MDLLGFFKRKIGFLEKKIRSLLKTTSATPDPPDPDRMQPGSLQPARGWAAIGCRMRSREGTVRLGAVRAGVWPRRHRPSRSGSRRIGCGYAGMWPPVHYPLPVSSTAVQGA